MAGLAIRGAPGNLTSVGAVPYDAERHSRWIVEQSEGLTVSPWAMSKMTLDVRRDGSGRPDRPAETPVTFVTEGDSPTVALHAISADLLVSLIAEMAADATPNRVICVRLSIAQLPRETPSSA